MDMNIYFNGYTPDTWKQDEVSTLHKTSKTELVHYAAGTVMKDGPISIEDPLMHAHTYVGISDLPPVGGVDGAYIIAREPTHKKDP